MTSKAAYTTGTAEGQYMASQTSPEGVTTAYAWDVAKGLLKNVSVSGHQADYSYDTMDRLTKVAGKAAVNGMTHAASKVNDPLFDLRQMRRGVSFASCLDIVLFALLGRDL